MFFNIFINREACGVLSLQRGFDKDGGVGVKSVVLRAQGGWNREISVRVLSGGLTMEHGCDKESAIVVQNKVNNVILTPKEKKSLRNKRHWLKKKNMESSVGVQSGGLKLEHGCDKESTIVVQHKVNNVILTPKEKRALHNKRYRLKKKSMKSSVGVKGGELTLEHGCDKENIILV